MRVLIAEDEAVSRRLLEAALSRWGYQVSIAVDGAEAWKVMQEPDSPMLVVLDWLMPGFDGLELCRRARRHARLNSAYILLLTSRTAKEDIVQGLEAGADDYVTKPFDTSELRARIQVGARLVSLQSALAERVRELEGALSHVKQLHGLLPICCYCKKIRDDKNYWHQVETYVASHADVRFSHGICPECSARLKEQLERGDTGQAHA
jgi:phosphoserine phosphatase RsbU/P